MNIFADSDINNKTFVIADNILQDPGATYAVQVIGLKGIIQVSDKQVKRFITQDSIALKAPILKVTAQDVIDELMCNLTDKY